MEKPTVFLSHSSLDKAALATLKTLLDNRAAGSLNFFLSSDGESIRFGRNWVVRISDALSEAKLMFVFLSPHSADSKWIHFEAGCAYAKDIQVVPVCLPGIDLNRISPPLSLLQGFNLHSHETMGNLARICNDTVEMKIKESFSPEDFASIVANTKCHGPGFFGDCWAINALKITVRDSIPDDFNPIPALNDICRKAGMNCYYSQKGDPGTKLDIRFEQPGCIVEFGSSTVRERANSPDGAPAVPVRRNSNIDCTLSPELFLINATLLDQWIEQVRFAAPFILTIEFAEQVVVEEERHNLTTKLHQCGIHLAGEHAFEFEGLEFNLLRMWKHWGLQIKRDRKLVDERLPRILEGLIRTSALLVREHPLSELLQSD